jgi:hypothetical protein
MVMPDDIRSRFRRSYDQPLPNRAQPQPVARPIAVSVAQTQPTVPTPPAPAPVSHHQPIQNIEHKLVVPSQTLRQADDSGEQPIPIFRTQNAQNEPETATEAYAKPAETTHLAKAVSQSPQASGHLPVYQPANVPARDVAEPPTTDNLPPETAVTPVERHGKRNGRDKPLLSKQKLAFIGATLLVAIIAATAGWAVAHKGGNATVAVAVDLLPSQYNSASLGFQVYFPKNLPAGYRVAPQSYSVSKGALVFYIDTPDGKTLPVSEQIVPTGSTAKDLVPAPAGIKVSNAVQINLPEGVSAFSKWSDKSLTSTVIGKTWIILNVTNKPEDASVITKSFTKI